MRPLVATTTEVKREPSTWPAPRREPSSASSATRMEEPICDIGQASFSMASGCSTCRTRTPRRKILTWTNCRKCTVRDRGLHRRRRRRLVFGVGCSWCRRSLAFIRCGHGLRFSSAISEAICTYIVFIMLHDMLDLRFPFPKFFLIANTPSKNTVYVTIYHIYHVFNSDRPPQKLNPQYPEPP